MFLINAIYFLGSWTYEFNPDYTEIETFLLEDGNRVDCQMMSHRNEHLYFQNQTCQGVDLPYGDGKFRMMIILPNENIHIDSLIDQLDNDTWNSWLSQFEPTDINLYLPKFKLEYKHQLNRVLKSMGMSIAFSSQADFSRIESSGGLYISKVLHKTFIDVNEEGTEAAAVTFVVMDRGSSSDNPRIPTMWINHPFIFAIHEVESETILFIGKIIQPEYED